MLRSVLEASSRQTIKRQIKRQIVQQWYLSANFHCQKSFSSQSQRSTSEDHIPHGKFSGSKNAVSKIVLGGATFGAAVYVFYHTIYLNQVGNKDQGQSRDLVEKSSESGQTTDEPLGKNSISSSSEELNSASLIHQSEHDQSHVGHSDGEDGFHDDESSVLTPNHANTRSQNDDIPKSSQSPGIAEDKIIDSAILIKDNADTESPDVKASSQSEEITSSSLDQREETATSESQVMEISSDANVREENKVVLRHAGEDDMQKGTSCECSEVEDSSKEAHLIDGTTSPVSLSVGQPQKQGEEMAVDDLSGTYVLSDGKLVVDFLEAVHAAERRQQELDARAFAEEKRRLMDKYEKELKDTRAREVMYAEETAILDKEIDRLRESSEAALKSLQEKAAENLKIKLMEKEHESSLNTRKMKELAKAELVAAVAREKASHIKKMADANLHINALRSAFYARSEEARQSHSIYKLASSLLLLEDALTKGLPMDKELENLVEKDPLLGSVLSSIPHQARKSGTNTLLQLNQKFSYLKTFLRPLSLVPEHGGGILTHALAHIASFLRVRERDLSGEGIESVISRVEACLAAGKLVEAADSLEEGVSGTRAAEVCGEWVRCARDRAVTEQALDLLQSYACLMDKTYG